MKPPGTTAEAGFTFLIGSDAQGRDMLSTMVYGLRTSVLVAVVACTIFPGLLLMVLIFSINIAGDRLREVLNPRLMGR
jgi:ABC-type dipeptide/oligopeptide/nickel transport system permease subunit